MLKNLLRGVLVCVFVFGFFTNAFSQMVLDLQKAIELALKNYPEILEAKEDVGLAKNSLFQAKSAYYPKISASGVYNRLNKDQAFSSYFDPQLRNLIRNATVTHFADVKNQVVPALIAETEKTIKNDAQLDQIIVANACAAAKGGTPCTQQELAFFSQNFTYTQRAIFLLNSTNLIVGIDPQTGQPIYQQLNPLRSLGTLTTLKDLFGDDPLTTDRVEVTNHSFDFWAKQPSLMVGGKDISFYDLAEQLRFVSVIDKVDTRGIGKENATFRLSLQMPIYTFGYLEAINKQAKNNVEIKQLDVKKKELEVIKKVKETYWGVVVANNSLNLLSEILSDFEAIEELLTKLYDAGDERVLKTDILEIVIYKNEISKLISEANKRKSTYLSGLKKLCGLEDNKDIKVKDEEIKFEEKEINLQNLLQKSLKARPEILQIKKGKDALLAKIKEEKARQLPKIGLDATWWHSEDYANFNHPLYSGSHWRITIGTEVPVFSLTDTAKIKEAKMNVKKLEHKEKLLQKGIEIQVEKAYYDLQDIKDKIKIVQEQIKFSGERKSLLRTAYEQGMGVRIKDILDSYIQDTKLKGEEKLLIYDYQKALAELSYQVGEEI